MKPLQRIITVFSVFVFMLAGTGSTAAPQAAASTATRILVWGDSLSAAYGIPVEKGWVRLLGEQLGDSFAITNGSISGETSKGGLARLPDALENIQPDFLLLELGANDGLQGMPPDNMRANLAGMIELARTAEAEVVLIGIKIPPNYGPQYTEKFEAVYRELAEQYRLPFIPFLLEGVAEDFSLMQADGLHPLAEAQPRILAHVWPTLEPVLIPDEQGAGTAAGNHDEKHTDTTGAGS
ncbi:MAG: arylesterase [Thiothrix sp.]|nr:arylesterase [Thiothrix sp.]